MSEHEVSKSLQKIAIEGHFDAVCGYLSSKYEVSITPFLTWAMRHQIPVFCPVVNEKHISFFALEPDTKLAINSVGLSEPVESTPLDRAGQFKKILLCCPGVAFDLSGNRLGQGGGYYDRFLQKDENRVCHSYGIAFDLQVSRDPLPTLPHDMTISALVTPKKVTYFGI